MIPRRPVTRWVAQGGMPITLAYATFTSRNRDGWWLTCRHPSSGLILAEVRVHLDHPDPAKRAAAEADLTEALDAVGAIPVIMPTDEGLKSPEKPSAAPVTPIHPGAPERPPR